MTIEDQLEQILENQKTIARALEKLLPEGNYGSEVDNIARNLRSIYN